MTPDLPRETRELLSQELPFAPAAPPRRVRTPDVTTLLALAAARPDGLELLMKAPLETAAIVFGVHVFTVEEARRLLVGGADA